MMWTEINKQNYLTYENLGKKIVDLSHQALKPGVLHCMADDFIWNEYLFKEEQNSLLYYSDTKNTLFFFLKQSNEKWYILHLLAFGNLDVLKLMFNLKLNDLQKDKNCSFYYVPLGEDYDRSFENKLDKTIESGYWIIKCQ